MLILFSTSISNWVKGNLILKMCSIHSFTKKPPSWLKSNNHYQGTRLPYDLKLSIFPVVLYIDLSLRTLSRTNEVGPPFLAHYESMGVRSPMSIYPDSRDTFFISLVNLAINSPSTGGPPQPHTMPSLS